MDISKIEDLIKILENSRTSELAVRKGDCVVCLRRGHKPKPAVSALKKAKPAEPAADTAVAAPEGLFILAPMVGIFHRVDGITTVGTSVTEGQVVGTIESMKLLNDVVAGISGSVSEVLVEDGTPVEYGQPLCRIEHA